MTQVAVDLDDVRRRATADFQVGIDTIGQSREGWTVQLISRCEAANDIHEEIERVLDELAASPNEQVGFLLTLASSFRSKGDILTAVNYLSVAMDLARSGTPQMRQELAMHMAAAGQQNLAMDVLFFNSLLEVGKRSGCDDFVRSMQVAYGNIRGAEQASREHGHELLLSYLKYNLPRIRKVVGGGVLSMVEIGTTRESVPGQGSTRRLGEFCREHGIDFVTVDMDPQNSRVAQKMFDSSDMAFKAVTMKGEDYLRERAAPVDFVFLDAYDFDHGKHSELRQSRYVKFLGSRIDEQACHQMHLDCAESVRRLLSPVGVVCIDDTWMDNDAWTAKGTLAMPYLLEHGFELIDARNRAALLKRVEHMASETK